MKAWSMILAGLIAGIAVTAAAKNYLQDWQSADAPQDKSEIVTIPEFPRKGRHFEVLRTYNNPYHKYQMKRKTPPEGQKEILKVDNDKGALQFWRKGKFVFSIKLGPCFSFAKMDKHHDFAARGSPAYLTAPPDCRIWNGREWHETYRTLVVGWSNPCVYETKSKALVQKTENGRILTSFADIHMTMENDGKTYDYSNFVVFDEKLKFFKEISVGYIGRVVVLREVSPDVLAKAQANAN